jgi:hypothetical protein
MATMVIAGVAWSVLAIWIDGPQSRVAADALAIVIVLGSALPVMKLRPLRLGLAVTMLPVVCRRGARRG